jgi:hypothetical protein
MRPAPQLDLTTCRATRAALFTTMGGLPGLLAIALLAEAIGFYRSGWFFTIGCTPPPGRHLLVLSQFIWAH